MKHTILLVDDDPNFLSLMELALEEGNFNIISVNRPKEALRIIAESHEAVDLIVSDINMPEISGEDLLREVKRLDSSIEVILITGNSALDAAARSIIDGAYDYLIKPFNSKGLLNTVNNALEHKRLSKELHNDQPLEVTKLKQQLIGQSQKMIDLFKEIGRVAPTNSTVLILGESGTGKEVIAKQIYKMSNRSNKKFIAVNCGALSETLLESELFGHARGAFTGATDKRIGLFEEASEGTIFLDEITETSQAFQLKLLRVLQEGEILPVGTSTAKKVNVRVLAASNQNIEQAVTEKRFRADLYYRLRVITLAIPPLRERKTDIALLATYFLDKYASKRAKDTRLKFSPAVLQAFQYYHWPGNVRQLEHTVEQLAIMSHSVVIDLDDLPSEIRSNIPINLANSEQEDTAILLPMAEVAYLHAQKVLSAVKGNKAQASRILDIDRKTLDRILSRAKETN